MSDRTADAANAADTVVFETELAPYRSLSTKGLRVLIGGLLLASMAITIVFWTLGAWPVAGFNGVEIVLAALLMRVHAKALKRREILRLTEAGLRIVRDDGKGGRSEHELQPAWLRISLKERPGRCPGLYLSNRGRHIEVATMLGEPEKRDLFDRLAEALHALRNPTFINPQLAE